MECENPIGIAIFAVVLFALGAMFVGGFSNNSPQYLISSQDQIPQISVQGSAQMTTEPDQVKLYLYITTLEQTAKFSQEENAKINEKVQASLLGEEIDKENIKTTSYSVQIREEWEKDNNGTYSYVFKGYETTHRIEVTIKDLDNAGIVTDKVVEDGALVEYVQFSLSDAKRKTLEQTLISDAVSNARALASKIAQAGGATLGKLQSASYGTPSYYYPTRYDYSLSAKEYDSAVPETSFSSGEITFSVSVSTSFAIE